MTRRGYACSHCFALRLCRALEKCAASKTAPAPAVIYDNWADSILAEALEELDAIRVWQHYIWNIVQEVVGVRVIDRPRVSRKVQGREAVAAGKYCTIR
jgi:hypothetical protein